MVDALKLYLIIAVKDYLAVIVIVKNHYKILFCVLCKNRYIALVSFIVQLFTQAHICPVFPHWNTNPGCTF